jgi:hypothetical protein
LPPAVPRYRASGNGGFFFINDQNELFLYHQGQVLGPAPLDTLYAQEGGGTAAAASRRLQAQNDVKEPLHAGLPGQHGSGWSRVSQDQPTQGQPRRDLLQDGAEASLSLVSTDSDGSTLWIVLGNG